jgi:hypothetical protein
VNPSDIFKQGYVSYIEDYDVYSSNPYSRIDVRHNGLVKCLQPEAAIFYNGWNFAQRQKTGRRYSIFLDDFRLPNWINFIKYPEGASWHVARHYYEFTNVIKEWGPPECVSFDYDLDLTGFDYSDLGPYKTGLDCAKWMIEHFDKWKMPPPILAVHSFNEGGRKQIGELLVNWLQKKS